MKKETKRDYLRRILGIKHGEQTYFYMSTIEKRYRIFMNEFKFNNERDPEVEKIFIYFNKESLMPSIITSKTAGKANRYKDLQKLHSKTIEYFNNNLKPEFWEKAKKKKPKDAMIYIDEVSLRNNLIINFKSMYEELDDDYQYMYDELYDDYHYIDELYDYFQYIEDKDKAEEDSLFLKPYDLDDFIRNFEDCRTYIKLYISMFMTCLFDDDFREATGNTDIDWLAEAVATFKTNYYKSMADFKTNYAENMNRSKDIYCNPYKNIYLYCLIAYLRDYYSIDMFDIKIGEFYELKNFDFKIDEKEIYSLSDIAEIYCKMCGLDEKELEKVKKRMQKEYKKLNCLKMYKNKKGKYEFKDIYFPLFMYVYYRRKNHSCCLNDNVCILDSIQNIYVPLLRGTINKRNKELKIYKEMYDFLNNAFLKQSDVLDDEYLIIMTEQLKYACSTVVLHKSNARIDALRKE